MLSFLPAVFSEMSGTGEDISQVHWKQQWLENGTLYFHVSMTESELLAQTTQATPREPAHILHEHMHLLHISVMVSCLFFFFNYYFLFSCSDCAVWVNVGGARCKEGAAASAPPAGRFQNASSRG